MTEYIMRYSGEGEDLHDLKKVGELVRCRDCINRQHDTIFNISWCKGKAVKPTGYCNEGRRR